MTQYPKHIQDLLSIKAAEPKTYKVEMAPQVLSAIMTLLRKMPADEIGAVLESFEKQKRAQLEASNPHLKQLRLALLDHDRALLQAEIDLSRVTQPDSIGVGRTEEFED